MDDFLYVLLVIGWLAFSFYQQSAKKKKKAEQQRQAAMMQQAEQDDGASWHEESEEPAQSVKPDFKSALEEILLGTQLNTLADTPAETATKAPEEKEPARPYRKYYDSEIREEPEWSEDRLESPALAPMASRHKNNLPPGQPEPDLEKSETSTTDESTRAYYFDLRRAMIYSEILNAKYVN